MNSLTTTPTQHAFRTSTSLLAGTKPSKNITDPNFRTTNPDIFPSLSPFSNFYNKKKQNETRTSCKNYSDDLEPVKKYKLDNGSSKVVPSVNKLDPSPISPELKTTEKGTFRVPRLPKRLCEKKSLSSSAKVTPIGNFNASVEPFAGKNNLMQDLKSPANVTLTRPIEGQKAQNGVSQKENSGLCPTMDESILNDLYERFRLEFLLWQYNQANCVEMKSLESNLKKIVGYEVSETNMEDQIARSKDLLMEQIKKTEVDC